MNQSIPSPRPAQQPRRLQRSEVLRFAAGRGLCLRADSGSLWVTVDGEAADIELDAGQSRRFDGRHAVIVSTLGGDAVFSAALLPPHGGRAAAWLQRLGLPRWRAGTGVRAALKGAST